MRALCASHATVNMETRPHRLAWKAIFAGGGNPLERILPEMGGVGRNASLDPLQKDAEAGVEAPVKIVACLVSCERPEDAARGWQPVGDPSLQTLQQFAPLEGMPRRLGALGDREPVDEIYHRVGSPHYLSGW